MTLTEIETTLGQLASRHPGLNEELLTTLLLAAGWEEMALKEALMLFKQKQFTVVPPQTSMETVSVASTINVSVPPVVHEEIVQTSDVGMVSDPLVTTPDTAITFYQPDGTEEKKLHAFDDVVTVREALQKKDILVPLSEKPKIETIPVIAQASVDVFPQEEVTIKTPGQGVVQSIQEHEHIISNDFTEVRKATAIDQSVAIHEKEPESLIVHNEQSSVRAEVKEQNLPGNLALLPFESSPHVWSFSRYKDVFHGEVMPTQEATQAKQIQEVAHTPVAAPASVATTIPVSPVKGFKEEDEITLEKAPMTRGDESLVFLASVMLLVIILILGYMYSNGRL